MQGWFKDQNQSTEVWKAGEYYVIQSPSLILNNKVLGCAGCVYEQNAGGTTTTMNMVQPIHMNGLLNARDAQQEVLNKQREAAAIEARRKALEAATATPKRF